MTADIVRAFGCSVGLLGQCCDTAAISLIMQLSINGRVTYTAWVHWTKCKCPVMSFHCSEWHAIYLLSFELLEIEPGILYLLGKCSITDLLSSLFLLFI